MTGATPVAGPPRTRWSVARYWVRRVLVVELWAYLSILRFALRRPRVPPGARAFTHHRLVMPLLVVFIVVSAVELVVVDLLVRRWEGVRVGLLVLGIWGLVWMFGLLLGFVTRPHAVGADGLRLRSGAELDVALPWERVGSVERHRRAAPEKQPQITEDGDGDRTLHLHVQDETNARVVLTGPVTVRLPRGAQDVTVIEVWVDEPDAFVAEAGPHLLRRTTGTPS